MGSKERHIEFLSILFLWPLICFPQKQDTLLSYFQRLNESGSYQLLIDQHSLVRNEIRQHPDYYFFLATAFEGLNREDSAFYYYKLAKEDYSKKGIRKKVALMNLEISSLLESQNDLEPNPLYFNEFWEYALDANDTSLIAQGYNYKGRTSFMDKNPRIPLNYFKKAQALFDSIGDKESATTNIMNIGVVYSNRFKNNDSARYNYFRALDLLKEDNYLITFTNLHHDLLNNIGNSYRRSKKYQEALRAYKTAETLKVKKYHSKTKKILYDNMNLTYYLLGDYRNAYNYLYKYDSIKDEINLTNQNSIISDIQEKYDNQKLRADNLEIETKRIQNRNLLLASLGLILVGTGIAILLHKNTTKKRMLAEQQQQIEKQKVETLLKEQELVSIDAMIAGQEKERQKVANELHDDLGSLMATVKLHFDNVKVDSKDLALKNAQNLLEEAYQKIRGMAHAKNSGVMANQGLVPAVRKMAQTLSESNAIEVSVGDFGMEERLENSLELTIFRMIQELVANIIKHAEATSASIQFTQHEDNLNIIVADNGKGFERGAGKEKEKGIGLSTIEKRIEHLEGNFTIDSVPGKGTSILIDIPV